MAVRGGEQGQAGELGKQGQGLAEDKAGFVGITGNDIRQVGQAAQDVGATVDDGLGLAGRQIGQAVQGVLGSGLGQVAFFDGRSHMEGNGRGQRKQYQPEQSRTQALVQPPCHGCDPGSVQVAPWEWDGAANSQRIGDFRFESKGGPARRLVRSGRRQVGLAKDKPSGFQKGGKIFRGSPAGHVGHDKTGFGSGHGR